VVRHGAASRADVAIGGKALGTRLLVQLYRRREPSSPAFAMMAAIGGTSPTTTEITTAAVTENSRTTVHARATATMHPPIKMK
jgi:hypothetical protein